MVSTDRASETHRRDIQGLRAVAVLLVIADHAGVASVSGGFVGVDVFFVLSGYLITLLLVREASATGGVRLTDFYARRARRILPAATVVIVVTMAYAAHALSLSRVQQLRDDAVWSAAFAANLRFAAVEADYFAQGREPSPFQHFWSLAVEEQFYLAWPLLLAVVLHLGARRGASAVGIRGLTALLAAIVLVSLAWSVQRTEAAPGTAYYSSAARAWELGIGALVALQQPRLVALGRQARRGLGVVGLAAVGVAAVTYDAGSAFPGWRALLPVLGAAAVVAAGAAGPSGVSRMLCVQPLPWLGDLSYSLYLWHWPILVLGPGSHHRVVGVQGTVILLAATLLLSVATFHLVENPSRRSRVLLRGRRGLALWPIAIGTVLVGVTAAQGHAAAALQERMTASTVVPSSPTPSGTSAERPGRQGRRSTEGVTSAARRSLVDRLTAALGQADSGAPVPFPLSNPDVRTEIFLDLDCLAEPTETATRVCPAGHPDAQRTMVVLGDSQVGQWMPALDLLGRRERLRVLPLVKMGCPAYDVPVVDGAGADYWQCDEFRRWAAAQIAASPPDIVVVASESGSARNRARPGLDLDRTWALGVASLLDRLDGIGAAVVVLADTPDLAFDPLECVTAPDSRLRDCVGVPQAGLAAANALTRDVARDHGAGFVDTVDLLCVRGRCPLVVDQMLTFRDFAHVSAAWATALADDLRQRYQDALDEVGADQR